MSDPIKWAGLDKELEKGIRALKEDLDRQYRQKIEELEKKVATADKQREWSSFYVSGDAHFIPAFRLNACPRSDLSKEALGRLHYAFSKEFTQWSLFVRFYCANNRREDYELWVIKSNTQQWRQDEPEEAKAQHNKLTREEEVAMRNFVIGFERGIHAIKRRRR